MKTTARQSGPLLDVLQASLGIDSKSRIRKMLKFGMVRLDGAPVTRADHPVEAGQQIEYRKKSGVKKSVKPPLPLLYEDDDILVTEKPPGLLTYGEKGSGGTSLYRMLRDFVKKRSEGRQRLCIVHRLDREVSGLILFAKHGKAQETLKANWNDTKKRYLALVEGAPPSAEGTCQTWLREGADRRVYSVDRPRGAKLAVTHYRVAKKLPAHTLLEIRIETGRKNQIRVHLSELGCPIVGDRRYGADASVIRRIRLHASYLGFTHPFTGHFHEFESPLPKGFLTLKNKDENYKAGMVG
jgi:23S rRNA pseudouridine1911/1915/1917 synthase